MIRGDYLRVGKVVAIDEKTARVRCVLEDLDEMVTWWLPVLHHKTQDDKSYWLPDIGEEVLIGFLHHGIEHGFILGSIYNEKDEPPVFDKDKAHIRFKDGSILEYDRRTHTLTLDIKGDITIKAKGNVSIVVDGDTNITTKGHTTIKSEGKIDLNGGGNDLSGVVTHGCICPFTGHPHSDYSIDVKASRG